MDAALSRVVHKVIHSRFTDVDTWYDRRFWGSSISYPKSNGLHGWITRRIVWRLASNANYDLMYCFCSIFLNNSLGRPIVSDDSPMPKLVICERHPNVIIGCSAGFVCSKFWTEPSDYWQCSLNLSTVFRSESGWSCRKRYGHHGTNIVRRDFLSFFWVFSAVLAWLTHKIVKPQNRRGIAWFWDLLSLYFHVSHCFLWFFINV